MRKRIIKQSSKELSPPEQGWLDLELFAEIEISSENAAHSIESAIIPGTGPGWRAMHPGEQTVRLLFAKPLRIRRIHLKFEEENQARTQEFVLRWSVDGQQTYREIVRQQVPGRGQTKRVRSFPGSADTACGVRSTSQLVAQGPDPSRHRVVQGSGR